MRKRDHPIRRPGSASLSSSSSSFSTSLLKPTSASAAKAVKNPRSTVSSEPHKTHLHRLKPASSSTISQRLRSNQSSRLHSSNGTTSSSSLSESVSMANNKKPKTLSPNGYGHDLFDCKTPEILTEQDIDFLPAIPQLEAQYGPNNSMAYFTPVPLMPEVENEEANKLRREESAKQMWQKYQEASPSEASALNEGKHDILFF